jgi:hypothetical protein
MVCEYGNGSRKVQYDVHYQVDPNKIMFQIMSSAQHLQLKSLLHLLFIGATTDIQKVGR